MKITVSQKEKKLEIVFEERIYHPSPLLSKEGIKGRLKSDKFVDKYAIDKAEDFLLAIDSFIKKRTISDRCGFFQRLTRQDFILEFHNAGLLTERVIKAIIKGLTINI